MRHNAPVFEVVTPAAESVVGLAETKQHLRVDIDDDDSTIQGFIDAAQDYLQSVMGWRFIEQTITQYFDSFPVGDSLVLAFPPLQNVTKIAYTDKDDNESTLSSSVYTVDSVSTPGRVVLKHGENWPSVDLAPVNPVAVTFVCGWSDAATVLPAMRQATFMLVGHYYENRETIVATGAVPKEIPFSVESLVMLNRVRWVA